MNTRISRLLLAAGLALCSPICFGQEIAVSAAKAGGVYDVGEKIVWRLEVKGEGANTVNAVRYVLKQGGLKEVGKGELTLQDGAAMLETKLDEPGTILAEFSATPTGKETIKGAAGAVVAPTRIQPSAATPDDFDAFWKAKIEELNAVPAKPVLEPGDSGKANVDYWKIEMDNIRGAKIRGQLARPKTGAKLPALLIVQWAGVYPLAKNWATDRAAEGWLTLNINAHDLPIDQPADFYQQQTALKDYPGIGNDDREKSYFLRMYLSCYRAAEYLAGRDDWDGKTLVVAGGSQGGLQSLMIGGLHPKITAILASVPAGCDMTGPLVGRQPGWPMWYYKTGGKEAAKVIEASRYYDVVNFAKRIKCPTLISAGLIDTTCPPAGIAAAFNQIPVQQKELVVLERGAHQDRNGAHQLYYNRYGAWLWALKEGKPAPVAGPITVSQQTK